MTPVTTLTKRRSVWRVALVPALVMAGLFYERQRLVGDFPYPPDFVVYLIEFVLIEALVLGVGRKLWPGSARVDLVGVVVVPALFLACVVGDVLTTVAALAR